MASKGTRSQQLVELLSELFQLNQPDLDFGIYRVLHAKQEEVVAFLEKDLLPQVESAFAGYRSGDAQELQAALDKMVKQLADADVDPDLSPKVIRLRSELAEAIVDVAHLEAEVYDHLFRFFRRYYSDGDYLSKRVYRRGVYAIPYEGEETAYYWVNRDQYYIKTSEALRDYAFNLAAASDDAPRRVRLQVVRATDTSRDNAKSDSDKTRAFVPVLGELCQSRRRPTDPSIPLPQS